MKIDLRQGLAQNHPTAVSGSVEIQMPAEYQSQAPATFEGCCLCTGEGAYTVTGTLRFTITGACARCTKPASEQITVPIEERFAREISDLEEEEIFPIEGEFLQMDEALRQAALTALPYRLLCRPDCKGLCPICGVDRNETDCSCEMNTENPFAILRKLDLPEEV